MIAGCGPCVFTRHKHHVFFFFFSNNVIRPVSLFNLERRPKKDVSLAAAVFPRWTVMNDGRCRWARGFPFLTWTNIVPSRRRYFKDSLQRLKRNGNDLTNILSTLEKQRINKSLLVEGKRWRTLASYWLDSGGVLNPSGIGNYYIKRVGQSEWTNWQWTDGCLHYLWEV